MSWRVARSLDVLLEEINASAPLRSKVSDGSIGDAAHATRTSDHNPWVIYGGQGIVRARDFTHDPARGLDCNELAQALAALVAVGGHPACRSGAYVIWRSRIFSFDRRHEGWRVYSGSNPHDKHLHISVATDPAGFDSTRPWLITQEDDMPLSNEDVDRIAAAVAKTTPAAVLDAEIAADGRTVRKALRQASKAPEIEDRIVSRVKAILLSGVEHPAAATVTAEQIEAAVKQALREGTGD
jgi:hypothetical protein